MQFSVNKLALTGLTALTSLTTALPVAQGANPFTLDFHSAITFGSGTNITWQPTSTGTVTLVLMKGDSWNMEPVGTVASGIANTGTFWWTPEVNGEGYAIKIVADDNESNYNFTPQFSIY